MAERVVAISSHVNEIGKRVSDSKKKFTWQFRISDTTYTIALVSSALSGKRIVTLNDEEIYTEKNVLNMNFDFIHNLQGHSIRIHKQPETVNNYGCRIDNRSFDYLLKKAASGTANLEKKSSKYAAEEQDPFSEFANFASSTDVNSSKNEFGDFGDFAGFGDAPASSSSKKIEQKSQKNDDFFNFEAEKKESIQAENFETNNLMSFEENFRKMDLLGEDENQFATNTYGQYSNYLDLMDGKQDGSDTWGMEDPTKKKTFLENVKPDITGKQMLNKTRMTAVEMKKKAVDLLDL